MARFSSLPPELRHMIWKLSLVQVIEACWSSPNGFKLCYQEPILFRVCQEARAVLIPFIRKQLIKLARYHQAIPFNFELDMFYFPYHSSCSKSYGLSLRNLLLKYPELKQLKHLALSVPPRRSPDAITMRFLGEVQRIARCKTGPSMSLETLTLVFQDPIICGQAERGKADIGSPAAQLPPITQSFSDIDASNFLQEDLWDWDAAAESLKEFLDYDYSDGHDDALWCDNFVYLRHFFVPPQLRQRPEYTSLGSPRILWKTANRPVHS